MNSKIQRQRERGRQIEAVGGWLLLATMVVAPWYYGSTRGEAIWLLGALLTGAAGIGLVGCWVKRKLPQVPLLCGLAAAGLAVLGWALLPLATKPGLSDFSLAAVQWNLERWPFSTTIRPPLAMALLATGLAGVLILAADLGRSHLWRGRFVMAMAITGGSIALLGMVQVMQGSTSIFNQTPYGDLRDVMPGHFFATFFHHSIAGSFLNLCWPMALLFALGRSGGKEGLRHRLVAVAGVVTLAAVFVNVSKAGMALAGLLAVALLLWPGWPLLRALRSRERWLAGGAVAALILLGATAVWQTGRWDVTAHRWQEWSASMAEWEEGERSLTSFDRVEGNRLALRMAEESNWLGFGPGTWMRTFPEFTGDRTLEPFWLWMQFAHQDYLQWLVEWGAAGAALWLILMSGGLFRAVAMLGRVHWNAWSADALLLYGLALSLATLLLHASWDFPLQIPSILLYAMVISGLCWSSPAWRKKDDTPAFFTRPRPIAARPQRVQAISAVVSAPVSNN